MRNMTDMRFIFRHMHHTVPEGVFPTEKKKQRERMETLEKTEANNSKKEFTCFKTA